MSVKVKTQSYFTFKTYVADNNNYGMTFNLKAGYTNQSRLLIAFHDCLSTGFSDISQPHSSIDPGRNTTQMKTLR